MTEPSASPPQVSTLPPESGDGTQALPTMAGTHYGRFALQRFHAKGGLGEVHVAMDAELGREVALKRMQDRFVNDAAAKRRFLNEAEITAKLEHPGIVPIHGLVQDEQGQPCYAMRFIAGESLSEAIKKWHEAEPNYTALPFRQLLQRFISVCQTMAYAHSKDIIHRDVKPANVMLGPYGETLVVDWGLAKRLARDQKSVAREETEPLAVTVDYKPLDTDDRVMTQAGQVLGTAGYMSPEQAAGRWDAVGAASDVYSLGATLYELFTGQRPIRERDLQAMLQQTQAGDYPSPRQVKPAVPKALEAICQKAMALKLEKRYASATDLAADLEHWLADEPVSAYAEPWTLLLRRWGRRHRTFVTGFVVALVVGLISTALVLVAFDIALKRESSAKHRAEEERRRAEQARDRGRQIIDDVFNDATLDALKRQKDLTAEQKNFLANMLRYYQEFAQEEWSDEQGRLRQARAYSRMGWGCYVLGRREEGVPAYRRAVELRETLVADFPTVPEYRRELALSHYNLGVLLADLRQRLAAETAYRRAVELFDKLVADFPTVPEYRQEKAITHSSLGLLLKDLGQGQAAETAYRRALALRETLVTDFPTVPAYRQELARSLVNLGRLQADLGQHLAAETTIRRAVEFQEKLVADFPTVPAYCQGLAGGHNNLGMLLNDLGQWSAAETAYRRAVDLQEQLVADFPAVPVYRQELAASLTNQGILQADQRQGTAAETTFRRALTLQEKLVTDFPTVQVYRQELAGSYVNFGHLLQNQGQAAASLGWYAKAIALLQPLLQQEPRLVRERLFLRNSHWNRARALDTLGRYTEAVQDWGRAVALNTEAARTPYYRNQRALSLARAGQHAQAVAEANALAEAKEMEGDTLFNLACIYALATAAVKDDAKLQDQYAARAVELLRQAIAKGYKNIENLKKEEDLKVLRNREDFKKLLQDPEKAKP